MSKIYVYTKDVQTAKKAFFLAFSDVSPDLEPEGFIIVRDIKGYAGKKHPDGDLVFAGRELVVDQGRGGLDILAVDPDLAPGG